MAPLIHSEITAVIWTRKDAFNHWGLSVWFVANILNFRQFFLRRWRVVIKLTRILRHFEEYRENKNIVLSEPVFMVTKPVQIVMRKKIHRENTIYLQRLINSSVRGVVCYSAFIRTPS